MPCDLQCGDAWLYQPNPLTSGLTIDLLTWMWRKRNAKRSVIFGDASFIYHNLISISEILLNELNDTNFQTFWRLVCLPWMMIWVAHLTALCIVVRHVAACGIIANDLQDWCRIENTSYMHYTRRTMGWNGLPGGNRGLKARIRK